VAQLRREYPSFTLIASGGIADGLDMAKCIALGADIVGSARPILHALQKGGTASIVRLLRRWQRELKGAMFLTGSATLRDLQHADIVQTLTA
jgi:isopentenyl-diphosphate delta-isomerase